MGVKSLLAGPYARHIWKKVRSWDAHAALFQEKLFFSILKKAKKTVYGREHSFGRIKTYRDFRDRVPIVDYESIRPYIDRISRGEKNVLWPGRPRFFSMSSGTTSKIKYIPITSDSLRPHMAGTFLVLLSYVASSHKKKFLDKKWVFLGGNPTLEKKGTIRAGRATGIFNHLTPKMMNRSRFPTFETACETDWDKKIDLLVAESRDQDVAAIGGLPPWTQMYIDRLLEATGASHLIDVYPHLDLFVTGGMNLDPYREQLFSSIGKAIDIAEIYAASEGFIAFQDSPDNDDLLLAPDSGVFYEFVRAKDFATPQAKRLPLWQIEPGENYAVLITTKAGLYAYNLGDTVTFTSKNPYRLKVTGRLGQGLSICGEHLIAHEVEQSLYKALREEKASVTEFSVAPFKFKSGEYQARHDWYIEFKRPPQNLNSFISRVHTHLCHHNDYYETLWQAKALASPKIVPVKKNGFKNYMAKVGKLGGQNKVPRLRGDRDIVDQLDVM